MQTRLLKGLSANDRVAIRKVKVLPDLPIGANVAHHDSASMISPLTRGWTVLHAGYDSDASPFPLNEMVLYNARTGQRFHVAIEPETPVLRDLIEFDPTVDTIRGTSLEAIYEPLPEDGSITWRELNRQWFGRSKEVDAGFVLILRDHFVRFSIFNDLEAYNKLRDENGMPPMEPAIHATILKDITDYLTA